MFVSSCSHNHQYCQPLPHLRPVSSHFQGIRYLTTAQETDIGQRRTLKLSANLQSISRFQNNRTCRQILSHGSPHSNSLLNPHQSAYCKHHCTETALLYVHDHLISAIGSQKVSCFFLLDLSAAFDTIDHDILITRLSSWFDIHGSVLSWFKSYLSSRCFSVKCETDLSSWHTSSCGVPQGSVLGPPLLSLIHI